MKKTSRKRALSGRAQIIGYLMAGEWARNDDLPVSAYLARAYERGWRDCMAAARKEMGLPHIGLESAVRAARFLKPLR